MRLFNFAPVKFRFLVMSKDIKEARYRVLLARRININSLFEARTKARGSAADLRNRKDGYPAGREMSVWASTGTDFLKILAFPVPVLKCI